MAMSDLREAIDRLLRHNCTDDSTEHGHWVNVHEAAALAEAYLREHDAQIIGSTVVAWAVDKGAKAERERIRQRIEATMRELQAEIDDADDTGVHVGFVNALVNRRAGMGDVLSALGGSSESDA